MGHGVGTGVGGLLVGTGRGVAVYVGGTVAVGVLDGVVVDVNGTGVGELVGVLVCVLVGVAVCVTEGVDDAKRVGTVGGKDVTVTAATIVGPAATRCAGCGAQPANPKLKMTVTPVLNLLMLERMRPSLAEIRVSIK